MSTQTDDPTEIVTYELPLSVEDRLANIQSQLSVLLAQARYNGEGIRHISTIMEEIKTTAVDAFAGIKKDGLFSTLMNVRKGK